MNEGQPSQRKRGMLLEPTYGLVAAIPRKPTLREIGVEWIDAVNFFKNRSRFPAALYAAYHFATAIVFVVFFVRYFSISSALLVIGLATAMATVYNTVWYHRYCSHRAFKFRSIWWARLFLWTNPICFREESYVIPHHVHHSKSDQPGDPYGPHLGWIGSYLATESQQKMNLNISRSDYDRVAKSLEHIGFVKNSYEQYLRIGSVENMWHFGARMIFVHLFWGAIAYAVADWKGVLAWISAVFFYALIVRDFNYRGHGGYFGTQKKGIPLNQIFYGFIAGEWHDNHHAHPRSARSGLVWWQLDLPYWIIKLMKVCGAVHKYNAPDERAVRGRVTLEQSA